jgi:hypothetical protein
VAVHKVVDGSTTVFFAGLYWRLRKGVGMRALFFSLTALLLCNSAVGQPQTPIRTEDFTRAGDDGITFVKDPIAAVAFQLPKGWALREGTRWGDHETTLLLREVYSGLTASLYYQYPLQTSRSSDPDRAFQGFMQSKVRQRRDRDGLSDYHILGGSVQRRAVAGRPALSYMAEFTRADGEPMQEYMLTLMGSNIKVLYFVTQPASTDIGSFVKRLDAVVENLDIPPYK